MTIGNNRNFFPKNKNENRLKSLKLVIFQKNKNLFFTYTTTTVST